MPRTATTALQKHVWSRAEDLLVISKAPYGKSTITSGQISDLYEIAQDASSLAETVEGRNRILREVIVTCSIHLSEVSEPAISPSKAADILSECIKNLSESDSFPVCLISSERLLDTASSLNCFSRHRPDCDQRFPVYALCKAMRSLRITPEIVICVREPIAYLLSKYKRTMLQRRALGERHLRIDEFIDKQVALDASFPGSSVISHVLNLPLIKTLQQEAFLRCIPFEELVSSPNVCETMGIPSKSILSLSSFPRENSLAVSEKDDEQMSREIVSALSSKELIEAVAENQWHHGDVFMRRVEALR